MRPKYLISLMAVSLATQAAIAGNAVAGVGQPIGGVPGFGGMPAAPGFSPYGGSPYGNPYGNPYANPYSNPYANPYTNPYANPYGHPYASPYFGYGNGLQGTYSRGGYGIPQLIGGNTYSFNVAGAPLNFWRAPSGYYYPWMGGYNYTQYPIFVYNGQQNGASQALPPLSTIFSDLNDYLDKAKKEGKVGETEYEHLKRRASDLLSKENSLAYESGGTIDPSQEAEIRRDVEGLSAEVARSVRP
jgi:hypothetical protein